MAAQYWVFYIWFNARTHAFSFFHVIYVIRAHVIFCSRCVLCVCVRAARNSNFGENDNTEIVKEKLNWPTKKKKKEKKNPPLTSPNENQKQIFWALFWLSLLPLMLLFFCGSIHPFENRVESPQYQARIHTRTHHTHQFRLKICIFIIHIGIRYTHCACTEIFFSSFQL